VAQKQAQSSAGTPAVVDLNYVYGAVGQNNGQVTSVSSGLDTNFNEVYTYDQLNRLTAVTGCPNGDILYTLDRTDPSHFSSNPGVAADSGETERHSGRKLNAIPG